MDLAQFLSEVSNWVLYFFIYAGIGWVFESLWCSIKARPMHFINRGFLFGPICPIYGVGGVLINFLMKPTGMPWWQEMLLIALICSIVEYIASYVMEKKYHVRWWSYDHWYNPSINGRISLGTSTAFGVGGYLIMHYIHPSVVGFVSGFSFGAKMVLVVVMSIIFLIDNYMSNAAASSVKHALKGGHVDLTDEIKRYAFNYYRKQTRKTRKFARSILKQMKRAQKMTIKQLKKTQKQLKKAAKKAKDESLLRQKRIEARLKIYETRSRQRIEYLTKRHEVREEVAKTDLSTIPRKTEKLKKNSKIDLKKER